MTLSLKVEILKGDKVVRVVRLDDPRVAFCKAVAAVGIGYSARPQPVSRAMRLAKSRRAAE